MQATPTAMTEDGAEMVLTFSVQRICVREVGHEGDHIDRAWPCETWKAARR